jgi:hypothetical protein
LQTQRQLTAVRALLQATVTLLLLLLLLLPPLPLMMMLHPAMGMWKQ